MFWPQNNNAVIVQTHMIQLKQEDPQCLSETLRIFLRHWID